MGHERESARNEAERLKAWLVEKAYPLWAAYGADTVRGGFHERLNGRQPLDEARRARVQPRQVAAFSRSRELGWEGDADALARHGLDYFLTKFRRDDGLFRTLIESDGTPADDRVLLYDQAFALLGLAECHRVVASPDPYHLEALTLRSLLHALLERDGAGFETGLQPGMALSSNAHMHLLEACLAWNEVRDDAVWRGMADEIVELALERFIDRSQGFLREHFAADWTPLAGLTGRVIEPGHHYEWAWLLFRWASDEHPEVRSAAFRLIQIAEEHGVRNGVAVNALLDDLSPHDLKARLWPQTERIKAAARAAQITGDDRYWRIVVAATGALLRYLQTSVPGTWFDQMTPEGRLIEEPAPASSFYHLVSAVVELDQATR
jgi:mannose/cellobiose epimerase-like protein (N-acyl-D-glucosamine 2-epimerase family)